MNAIIKLFLVPRISLFCLLILFSFSSLADDLKAFVRITYTSGGANFQLSELALYDAEGNRVNVGLTRVSDAISPSEMLPGQWSLSKSLPSSSSETPDKLFDGNLGTKLCVNPNQSFPFSFTFCLPLSGIPVSYNMATANDALQRSPTGWYIECSRDGVEWTEVERLLNQSHPGAYKTWWYTPSKNFEKSYEWRRFAVSDIPVQSYKGVPVEPVDFEVRDEVTQEILERGVDYDLSYENNDNVGTATVILTGKGDYSGVYSKANFTIEGTYFEVSAERVLLNGDEIPPFQTVVVVRSGSEDKILTEGVDYTLEYFDNTKIGIARVKVKGKGNYVYAKDVEVAFAITGIFRVAPEAQGTGDGMSWENATTFTNAFKLTAQLGGVIWMKEGTYANVSESSAIVVSNAVMVHGGFVGTEKAASERIASKMSTIDGGRARDYLVWFENLEGNEVSFDRIVFTRAKWRALRKSGAGDLTIKDCSFIANGLDVGNKPQNRADGRGLYVAGENIAKIKIFNTSFERQFYNSSSDGEWAGSGMAIYATSCAQLFLDGCLFVTNGVKLSTSYKEFGGKFSGSALCALSTPVKASNCRFVGNIAAQGHGPDYKISDNVSGKDGACVFLDGACSGSVFSNCVFACNEEWISNISMTGGKREYGGAVMINLSSPSDTCDFRNCTIAYNLSQGENSPGGLNVVRGTVSLKDSIVYGNINGINNKTCPEDISVKAEGSLSISHSLLTSLETEKISAAQSAGLTIDVNTILTGDPKFVTSVEDFEKYIMTDNNFYRCFNTDPSIYSFIGNVDVHLLSIGGYRVNSGAMGEKTTITSPALDQGDKTVSCLEPQPNGGRINLGAYSNTQEASNTPDGIPSFGDVVTDVESDPGTIVFTIPFTGDKDYFADAYVCLSHYEQTGSGTNGWDFVIYLGERNNRGTVATVDLGILGKYYWKDAKVFWRIYAKGYYGEKSLDGSVVIPYDEGEPSPDITDVSNPDYEQDIGTAFYTFSLGGVGNYSVDVYMCSGGAGGEGTNGWKSVELVKAGGRRGDVISTPIGTYFDNGQLCPWRIVLMSGGEILAIEEGVARGVYDLPEFKGKRGAKYAVHLRQAAVGDGSGSDWYNACTSIQDALAAIIADPTKTEIWIAGNIDVSTSAQPVILKSPCMIRGGFTTLDEKTPAERNPLARSLLRNVNSAGTSIVCVNVEDSFGCDGIIFDNAQTTAVEIQAQGGETEVSFANCQFRKNSRLSAKASSESRFQMSNCDFTGNLSESAYGSALSLTSFASADISDTSFVTNGILFSKYSGGMSDRDVADAGYVANIKSTPVRFKRCEFRGGKGTGHNKIRYCGVIALHGNCDGSEFVNCSFTANGFLLINNGNEIVAEHTAPLVINMGNIARTVLIENCTFAYNFYNNNKGSAALLLAGCSATIRNSVFFGNFHTDTSAADIRVESSARADITYSMFQETNSLHISSDTIGAVTFGEGIKLGDPMLFTSLDQACKYMHTEGGVTDGIIIPKSISSYLTNAAACVSFDLHLKTPVGYLRKEDGRIVRSKIKEVSPGIDAGDPLSQWENEPGDNGQRINIGSYGNTSEAESSVLIGTVIYIR